MPRAIQIIKRHHVSEGKDAICKKHIPAPKIGTKGTKGVLKGRSASGRDLRSIITLTQTMTKANNVPMETNSPRILIGNNPATIAATDPVNIVVMYGV